MRVLSESDFKSSFLSKLTYSKRILFSWNPIKRKIGGASEIICAQGHTETKVIWQFSRWLISASPQATPQALMRRL